MRTRSATWAISGRNPLLGHLTPRALFWRRLVLKLSELILPSMSVEKIPAFVSNDCCLNFVEDNVHFSSCIFLNACSRIYLFCHYPGQGVRLLDLVVRVMLWEIFLVSNSKLSRCLVCLTFLYLGGEPDVFRLLIAVTFWLASN